MTFEARTSAGTNERKFEALFRAHLPLTPLNGKRRYTQGNVQISVDQSFTYDGTTYLVEVDSGNMAKLLVGQYILLNHLVPSNDRPAFFMVVHAYKDYKPQRTTANLSLVNQELLNGKGIPFGAVHLNSIANGWPNGVPSLLTCLTRA
ncbi:MAG: hypothetical protein ING39_08940 [Burkholderiales bacterium]|jgi:hypothetical protein|nr:hypothetical protein [Burkholderiales bacterium]